MVKLMMGLYQRYFIKKQEVFRGGEVSDGASLHKMQRGGVHNETSLWESQGA